jgi:hypothetical protein
VEDIDSVLSYVASLFDEGQQLGALRLWERANFREIPKVDRDKLVGYYKVAAQI